jgi:MFS family permease
MELNNKEQPLFSTELANAAPRNPMLIKLMVIMLIVCAGLGGILYGYDIGVISGALLFIKQAIPLTDTQMGIIVGAVLGGSLLGTLVTGFLADHYGRRRMIIAASLIFLVVYLL